jgi:N-acetylneuraminic acid mutarotase
MTSIEICLHSLIKIFCMIYFQKLQSGKWIFLILIVSIAIASCKKETTNSATAFNEKLSTANEVVLPPPIIGWGRGPDIPIVDQQGYPVNGDAYAFAFAIGGKGYIGGGYVYPQHARPTWQYDTLTRTWSQVANFPGANDVEAATFVIGKLAYVCTGGQHGSHENWQYSQLTNVWTRVADFPGANRIGAVGVAINGKGYVGLGANTDIGGDLKDWWEYDPSINTWTRKNDFSGTERNYGVAFAINEKGYVATGHHWNGLDNYYNDLWQYNPVNDKWVQKADMPGYGRWYAVGVNAFINNGVVATGRSGTTILNDCWEYFPSSNSWFQLPNVGGGPRSGAAAFAIGNTLYIGTGGISNDFWGLTINP